MSGERLLAFAIASFALVAFPGPNLIYIVTRSVGQGLKAGLVSAVGVETGTLIHIAAAAFGLSALLAASPVAFAVVRYAGAAYLVYLGLRALRATPELGLPGTAVRAPLGRVFRDGVVVNVLNPKVALFFLAFLPQFLSPEADARGQILILGALFFVLALTLDVAYAFAGEAVSTWLHRRPAFLRRQGLVIGGVYLGLGAYAALS